MAASIYHRSRDLPWSILAANVSSDRPHDTAVPAPVLSPQRKSFAQALHNVCDVPVGNFPKPCLKGKRLSIKIPEDSYKAGLDRCKNNLHGRLIMAKGDKPLRLHEIHEKLTKAWAPVNKWQITPLGKGFYEFYFQNCEDLNRVWSIETWNLKPGLLRLSAWSSDFKPENLKVTNAQIWIRIYGLPQEYWMPTTLFSIASGIGTPLSLDEATKQRTMGHFARILVDVNLAEELHYQILVEREGYAFFVEIDYENLPYFCEHCCCIGHSIDKCRNVNNKAKDQKKSVEKVVPNKPNPKFVPKQKNKNNEPVQDNEKINEEVSDYESLHPESDQENAEVVKDTFVEPIMNKEMRADNGNHADMIVKHAENDKNVDVTVDHAQHHEILNPRIVEQTSDIPVVHEKDRHLDKNPSSWADEVDDSQDEGGEYTVVTSKKGIGNLDTRLVLKNLCLKHKPNIIFISEPMISYAQFPGDFLRPLNLKRFALNFRRHGIPNLWGFCDLNIDPLVLQLSEQHVVFSLTFDQQTCYIAAIYASTSHVNRRELWSELNSLQSRFIGPWCMIGDFNAVLGAHEKYGRCLPNKTSCDEFSNWTNSNHLIHLDTLGNQFTWANARRGPAYAALRLDRVICNSMWIDTWNFVSCCTLPKVQSDHHPLLFNFDSDVQTFLSSFKFQSMWMSHDDCKRVISEHWKKDVVGCPMFILQAKLKSLKPILKSWNKDVFGDVNTKVSNAVAKVDSIQQIINDSGYTDALGDEEKLAQVSLNDSLRVQEHFWRDKSRSKWFVEGDRNTDLILEPLPNPILHLVNAKVAEVVHNQVWALPEIFKQQFPIITCDIHALSLPSIPEPDELVWEDSISGELTFKLAYSCGMQPPQCLGWTKFIWKLFIPPSRSLVAWRIMHNVIATDDNLIKRGLTIVSCCSLCGSSYETGTHLFLRCPFIMQYWNWLSSLLGMPLDLSNFDSLLGICNKGWSPQLHDLIIAAIVNILWKVWKCRNNVRFNDIYPYFSRDLIYVKSLIHQAAHYSKVARIRGRDGRIRRSEDLGHEEFLRRQAEELVPEVPPVVQPVVQPVVWPGGPIDTSLLTRYHEHVARHVWFGEVINFYL
ncbi:unnamed protein product [Trifolium pratense]|uniref:Uncharacterized protein n=1 Tax=Trifolium pratense TaxID=57577 RepID=A0ACB0JME1_TRIPR|nr:unnamed protein product [Trifolium pratense]